MIKIVLVTLMLAMGTGKEGDLYYVNSQGEEILVEESNVEIETFDSEYWQELEYNTKGN